MRNAAANGLILWLYTLVPTLLPYMILSKWLIGQLVLKKDKTGSRRGRVSVILAGYLCGYPMGASVASDLVKHGVLCPSDATYLMCFCNLPSPAFLISYVIIDQLEAARWLIPYLLLFYGTNILAAIALKSKLLKKYQGQIAAPVYPDTNHALSLDTIIGESVLIMLKIGGYVIFFSVLQYLLLVLTNHYSAIFALGASTLEISSGIRLIRSCHLSVRLETICMLSLCALGGFSTIGQIKGMLRRASLSFHTYFISRLLHMLLCSMALHLFFVIIDCLGIQ